MQMRCFLCFACATFATVDGALQLPSLKARAAMAKPLPLQGFLWAEDARGVVVPTHTVPTNEEATPLKIPVPLKVTGSEMSVKLRESVQATCIAALRLLVGKLNSLRAAMQTALTASAVLVSMQQNARQPPPPEGFVWGITTSASASPAAEVAVSPISMSTTATALRHCFNATALYWQAAAGRVTTHTPEALGVFADIGCGLAAASRDCSAVAAAATVSYSCAALTFLNGLSRRTIALSSAPLRFGVGSLRRLPTYVLGKVKMVGLKREGEIAVARREEMAAAYQRAVLALEDRAQSERTRLLKLETLKAEGHAAIARRAHAAGAAATPSTHAATDEFGMPSQGYIWAPIMAAPILAAYYGQAPAGSLDGAKKAFAESVATVLAAASA